MSNSNATTGTTEGTIDTEQRRRLLAEAMEPLQRLREGPQFVGYTGDVSPLTHEDLVRAAVNDYPRLLDSEDARVRLESENATLRRERDEAVKENKRTESLVKAADALAKRQAAHLKHTGQHTSWCDERDELISEAINLKPRAALAASQPETKSK